MEETTTFRETLVQALGFAQISELPPEDNGGALWMKAIAVVTKKDGTRAYCILYRTDFDTYMYKAVFGTCSPLHKVIKIYPYEVVMDLPVPKFAPKDKNSRIGFIKKNRPDESYNFEEMTIKDLDDVINKIGFEIYNKTTHAINKPQQVSDVSNGGANSEPEVKGIEKESDDVKKDVKSESTEQKPQQKKEPVTEEATEE